MRVPKAVGFDLGETLLFYEGTPLNWAALYPGALEAVAKACRVAPSAQGKEKAIEILSRHNTRLVPRAHEVASDVILGSILISWGLDSVLQLPVATESFFGFFQQRVRCYEDSVSLLAGL